LAGDGPSTDENVWLTIEVSSVKRPLAIKSLTIPFQSFRKEKGCSQKLPG
jgi:hypothetical protein